MSDVTELNRKLHSIFMPSAMKSLTKFRESGGRLAHYTTAETALKIAQSKCMWMRNARNMVDFSEIEHGFQLLRKYFHPDGDSAQFHAALDSVAQGVCKNAIEHFNKHWDKTRLSTYISCFSNHLEIEDKNGRLSLWRAFGNTESSVAIVLRNLPQERDSPLGVFFSPVAYMSYEQLKVELDKVAEEIAKNTEFLRTVGRDQLVMRIFMTLVTFTISLKHPAFAEEQEWRLIHLPELMPSPLVSRSVETVRGVPQIVHKVHMRNDAEKGIAGIEIHEILDRVIIGPTQYGLGIFDAMVQVLTEAGLPSAHAKVYLSDIPLRT